MNLYPLTVVNRCARKAESVDNSWREKKKKKNPGQFHRPQKCFKTLVQIYRNQVLNKPHKSSPTLKKIPRLTERHCGTCKSAEWGQRGGRGGHLGDHPSA